MKGRRRQRPVFTPQSCIFSFQSRLIVFYQVDERLGFKRTEREMLEPFLNDVSKDPRYAKAILEIKKKLPKQAHKFIKRQFRLGNIARTLATNSLQSNTATTTIRPPNFVPNSCIIEFQSRLMTFFQLEARYGRNRTEWEKIQPFLNDVGKDERYAPIIASLQTYLTKNSHKVVQSPYQVVKSPYRLGNIAQTVIKAAAAWQVQSHFLLTTSVPKTSENIIDLTGSDDAAPTTGLVPQSNASTSVGSASVSEVSTTSTKNSKRKENESKFNRLLRGPKKRMLARATIESSNDTESLAMNDSRQKTQPSALNRVVSDTSSIVSDITEEQQNSCQVEPCPTHDYMSLYEDIII